MTEDATQPRAIVLINADAGTVKSTGKRDLRDVLTGAFLQAGVRANLKFLHYDEFEDGAKRACAAAVAGETDMIVVGGGDGTIRTVAAALADTNVPLGVLPLGTLNHFSKDLGIPADLEEAVAIIAARQTRMVDLGTVNGQVFINNSSVGIYPSLVVERERRTRENGTPKWISLFLSLFHVLRTFRPRSLHLSAEGVSDFSRTPCIFVGNNEYNLAGSSLGTRDRLDDGRLTLYVAKQASVLGLFVTACKALLGRLDYARDVRVFHAGKAEIRSSRRHVRVAMDGEVQRMAFPLRYAIKPGSLRVFAPPMPDVQQA